MGSLRAALRVAGVCIVLAGQATADPVLDGLDGMDEPAVAKRWRQANALESAGNRPGAHAAFERVAGLIPESADPHWRIARNLYEQSKANPGEDEAAQLALLDRAIAAAERGLELEPRCAQCMLWKYAALGRIPTLKGLMSGAGNAKTLAGLLQRGIELSEAREDPRGRATLAHFYYASAAFHRMVPDWFWLRWIFGVRGNKERALGDARRAIELDATRSDFEVELAANLLCLGHRDADAGLLEEADALLQRLRNLPGPSEADLANASLAVLLLEAPMKACGFSRDGFMDIDAAARSQAP